MSKVYLGNLDPKTTERELEDECMRFGRIYKLWIARNPPGFAFVDFEDARDAEDCVRKLDGRSGWRCEISRSRGPGGGGGGGGGRGGARGGGRGEMACYNCGEIGHMARDCRAPKGSGGGGDRYGGGGGGGYRRDSPPPRRRSYSPVRGGRDRSPAYGGGRDRSPAYGGGRDRSPAYGGRAASPVYGGGRARSPYAGGRDRSP